MQRVRLLNVNASTRADVRCQGDQWLLDAEFRTGSVVAMTSWPDRWVKLRRAGYYLSPSMKSRQKCK